MMMHFVLYIFEYLNLYAWPKLEMRCWWQLICKHMWWLVYILFIFQNN